MFVLGPSFSWRLLADRALFVLSALSLILLVTLSALLLAILLLDAQVVVDILEAGDTIKRILDLALGLAAINGAAQGHLAVLHLDINIAGVNCAMVGQALANIFLDPVIGALVAFGTAPAVGALLAILTARSLPAQAAAP
jgi:hypothetical protein